MAFFNMSMKIQTLAKKSSTFPQKFKKLGISIKHKPVMLKLSFETILHPLYDPYFSSVNI